MSDESAWLEKPRCSKSSFGVQVALLFLSFQLPLNKSFKTLFTLLELLFESINSPAMVRQCMGIVEQLFNSLNPGQVSVITRGQPVYDLCSNI